MSVCICKSRRNPHCTAHMGYRPRPSRVPLTKHRTYTKTWELKPAERIRRYVERWNKRNPDNHQHGPTIRETARALRMTQEDVELYMNDDPDLMPVHAFCTGDIPLGDWMIEILEDTRDK